MFTTELLRTVQSGPSKNGGVLNIVNTVETVYNATGCSDVPSFMA